MTGAELILSERARQTAEEGFSHEHDDAHVDGSLLVAALGYAECVRTSRVDGEGTFFEDPPCDWPWEDSWWKPSTDPIRTLTKAGALIAAEIDRLQRAGAKERL